MNPEDPNFTEGGQSVFGEKEALKQEEEWILPVDPRLEIFPRARLGPRIGDRDYGPIKEYDLQKYAPDDRILVENSIHDARRQGAPRTWHERVPLTNKKEVIIFLFDAQPWKESKRVFGEAYVVSNEHADEIEAVVKERIEQIRAKRQAGS